MMQMTKRAVVDLLYCFVTTKKDQSRETVGSKISKLGHYTSFRF